MLKLKILFHIDYSYQDKYCKLFFTDLDSKWKQFVDLPYKHKKLHAKLKLIADYYECDMQTMMQNNPNICGYYNNIFRFIPFNTTKPKQQNNAYACLMHRFITLSWEAGMRC